MGPTSEPNLRATHPSIGPKTCPKWMSNGSPRPQRIMRKRRSWVWVNHCLAGGLDHRDAPQKYIRHFVRRSGRLRPPRPPLAESLESGATKTKKQGSRKWFEERSEEQFLVKPVLADEPGRSRRVWQRALAQNQPKNEGPACCLYSRRHANHCHSTKVTESMPGLRLVLATSGPEPALLGESSTRAAARPSCVVARACECGPAQ